MAGWVGPARAIALEQVAAELELTRYGTHWGPCPKCGEQNRSKGDNRKGPIFFTRGGWACSRCDARGDGPDLVSYRLRGEQLTRATTAHVRTWYAARGWCEPSGDAPAPRRVTPRPAPVAEERRPARPAEVAELWGRCLPVVSSSPSGRWLRSRGLDPDVVRLRDLARELPTTGDLPTWAEHWRSTLPCPIVLPLYLPGSGLVGLQGRRIDGVAPKSVAARGVARVGVYSTDLRGAERILVAEGEPDYLTWATRPIRSRIPVIGLPGGGAWTEAVARSIPDGVDVLVRAHQDDSGRRYSAAVVESLRARCRVWVRA